MEFKTLANFANSGIIKKGLKYGSAMIDIRKSNIEFDLGNNNRVILRFDPLTNKVRIRKSFGTNTKTFDLSSESSAFEEFKEEDEKTAESIKFIVDNSPFFKE